MLVASIRTNEVPLMSQLTLPKVSTRTAPPRCRDVPHVRARSAAPPVRAGSNAAPLTLAAVVVLTLLLALATASVTALGG